MRNSRRLVVRRPARSKALWILPILAVVAVAAIGLLSPHDESAVDIASAGKEVSARGKTANVVPKLVNSIEPMRLQPEQPVERPTSKEIRPIPVPDQETICTADGCTGPEISKDKTRKFLNENLGRFKSEEIAILDAYTLDGMERAVRDAEHLYFHASDDDRPSVSEKYRMILNLASAVAPDPTPVSKETQDVYYKYREALELARVKLARLSPADADRAREKLKEEIFARLEKH